MNALRKHLSNSRARWLLAFAALASLAAVDVAALLNATPSPGSAGRAGGRLTSTATPAPQSNRAPIPLGLQPTDTVRRPTPRLELSAADLDLGDGKPKEILRGELTLTNRGAETAKFSLVKHCGCTELSPLSGELRPGASETIKLGVELRAYANSETKTSIDVQAGSPAEVVATCVLFARCPAPFNVTPAFINFGSLAKEDLGTASHEVHVDSAESQVSLSAEELTIEHAGDAFVVERTASPSAQSAILRVALKIILPRAISMIRLSFTLRVPITLCTCR